MNGKLCKSKDNKVITGVCAGIAEAYGWDPTLVRIVTAILCAVWGMGVIVYLIAALVMPESSDDGFVD